MTLMMMMMILTPLVGPIAIYTAAERGEGCEGRGAGESVAGVGSPRERGFADGEGSAFHRQCHGF